MNNYDVWNHLILNHFFNDQRAGESVRLNVTEDLLNSLGSVKNWNFEHFLDSLKEGSCFVLKNNDYTNICKYAEELYSFSKNGTRWPRDYIQNPLPPYVAILSFFVYLTTLQDPDNNSYYRRLWDHFPVDNRDHAPTFYPGFENMRELWKGLQEWSNSHNLGNFNIEVFDNFEPYQHLSIPKSQAILTENERQNLPRFFASAGLRSNTPMNFDRWRQAINDNPRFFMSLTIRALDDVYLSNYLIEDLNNELRGWDNNTPNQHGSTINHQNITQRSKSQKLVLFFDNNIRGLFPRLKFNSESFEYLDQVTYSCQNLTLYANLNNNWSNLHDSRGRFDASTISWTTPFKLQTENSSAPSELSFEPKQIRVFVSTSRLGLSGGYFEVDKLPSMGKCLIAFYQQKENEITEWFYKANLDIIFENNANLPEGWRLFHLNNIPTEQKIRDEFPGESESQEVKFNFIGGFKYKLRGRVANKKYYWFFPPDVELHGGYAGSTLTCNDNPMEIDSDGIAKLPENLGAGIFTIKMISNGDICSEDVIELVDVYHAGDPLRFYELFDKFGFAENNSKGFSGAWLEDSSVSNFEWDNDNQINRTVSLGGVRWGINPGSLSQEFINDAYGCKNYPLFYFYDLNNLNSDAPIQERKKSGERISEFHEQNGLFPPEKGLPLSRLLQFKDIRDRSVKVIDSNHGHMHAFLIPESGIAVIEQMTFLIMIDAESSGCILRFESTPREDQFPHSFGIYNAPAPFNQNPPQNFTSYQLEIMSGKSYWGVYKIKWGHNKWGQLNWNYSDPECCKVKQLRVGPWDVEELFCYLGLYEFLLKLGGNINVPSEISLSKDLDGLLTEQKGFANIHKRVINSPPLVPKVLSIKGSAQAKVFELPEYLDMPSSVKLAWRLAWIDRRVAWEGRTILNKVKIEHQLELRKALLIAFKIDDHSWAKIFTCCLSIAEYLLTIFIKNGLGKIIRYDEHPEFLSDKTNV